MKRKPIDPRGHVERPGIVPVCVACKNCDETRIKSQQWARPCTGAEKGAGSKR